MASIKDNILIEIWKFVFVVYPMARIYVNMQYQISLFAYPVIRKKYIILFCTIERLSLNQYKPSPKM